MRKKKLTTLFGYFGLVLLMSLAIGFFMPESAMAQKSPKDVCEGAGGVWSDANGCSCVPLGVGIDGEKCPGTTGDDVEGNVIFNWLVTVIKFLSAGVGIAVTGGIVYGGIIYIMARDNAANVQKAVMIIVNSMVGLLLYILMFAILNFLIPGGILT